MSECVRIMGTSRWDASGVGVMVACGHVVGRVEREMCVCVCVCVHVQIRLDFSLIESIIVQSFIFDLNEKINDPFLT